jgi:hypothetical protein
MKMADQIIAEKAYQHKTSSASECPNGSAKYLENLAIC